MLLTYDRTILSRAVLSTHKYKHRFKKLLACCCRYALTSLICNKGHFVSYSQYVNKRDFLDFFNYQQRTRRQNIKNLKTFSIKSNKPKIPKWFLILCLITPFTNWLIPLMLIGAFLKNNSRGRFI